MSEKNSYYSKTSPDQEWDYLIIGSGMGGMCTAAFLAKLGKKVLVLEQHYIPGGFTHTFKRKKWVWDVGVHAVGEVTEHTIIGRLLKSLTNDRLKWTSLGPCYDEFYFPGDFRINFPDHPQGFRDNLVKAFPEEQVGIDLYLAKVKKVAKVMQKYYVSRILPVTSEFVEGIIAGEAREHFRQNTKTVIDQLIKNDKLKTILAAQWGYYGSPPSRSSFAIQALVSKHFSYGGYYPIGGSQKIAAGLLTTVAENGGWTRIMAEVKEIIIKNRRASGVILKNGEEIRAKKIISAVNALTTISKLIPEQLRQEEWCRSISELKPSSAHLCLNIGFKGDIRKAGASSSNKWFFETWDNEDEYWNISDPQAQAPILYSSFPSLKDPEHNPGEEELHTGEIVTFVPYQVFEKWKETRLLHRGDDYEELKKKITEKMLRQFLRHMPELEPMVAYTELSTPLSTEHFTKAFNGAIYGIEPTPQRFNNKWLRPITPIKNLYFSGSDIATVGVIGAMAGGVISAMACEPIKGLGFLSRFRK